MNDKLKAIFAIGVMACNMGDKKTAKAALTDILVLVRGTSYQDVGMGMYDALSERVYLSGLL
tara:strand:+ start:1151 stop:1336 length:186 start_codon:yes stop_codon:yes gene_type:complete